MENKLVPRASYPIWSIDCAGLKRSLSPSNIKVLVKNLKAERQAKRLLESFCPDAVIGTGGYVCYPVVRAASKKGIYTALHESNAVTGLAVRMLKNRVNRIFVSFDCCMKALGNKASCILTGNPLRAQLDDISREQARQELGIKGKYRYVLVSFGGSLGAETVNSIALNIMEKLSAPRGDILHVHACGKNGAGGFFESFNSKGLVKYKNIKASEYIYDMSLYLKAADIVLCRSGAMTLAEIAQAGVASVLVPSSNVTGNHQYKNANEFAGAGAAFLVDEKKAGWLDTAFNHVSTLLSDRELRAEMAEKARGFAVPDAADKIAKQIIFDIKNR